MSRSKSELFPSTLPLVIGIGSPPAPSTVPVSGGPVLLEVERQLKAAPIRSLYICRPGSRHVSGHCRRGAQRHRQCSAYTKKFFIGFIIIPSSQPSHSPLIIPARNKNWQSQFPTGSKVGTAKSE